jgi:SagB-type dehydrogenase family enzyme
MEFMRDQDDLLFWSAFALQETLLLMSGIATDSYFNKLILHHYGPGGRYSTYQALAPVPGSQTSSLAAAKPMDVRSAAFLAWKHHCGTRFPPKKYLPPAAHQNHFTAQNIAGAQKPLPSEYGTSIHPLPEQWAIPPSLPWLNGGCHERVEFNALSLGNLLRVSVGHQKIQNQDRRISPCGGGLKSAGLFVRTRGVIGIEDGWYAYNASEHVLETIQNLDEDGISAAMGADDEAPVTLVVVGRLQRTRDKYREFGYNIIHLDAGVATAFATVLADSYGWQVCHHPNAANASLAHSLRIDEKDYFRLVSNVFSLGKPPRELNGVVPGDEENWLKDLIRVSRAVDPRPAMFGLGHRCPGGYWNHLTQRSDSRTFEDVLKSRRSSHSFKPFKQRPVKGALVEELVVIGHRARLRLADEGMFSIPFGIYLLRPLGDDELPSGAYETNSASMATWKCLSSPLSPEDINRCLNQNSLARAPLLFVMVADLDETLRSYGAAGYRHLLNQCGFVVGQIWLAASAAGLVGTACGIVIEEGMRNAIKSDGYTQASMFGFVLGEPEDKEKAG